MNWYEAAFGETYTRLYRHRDDAEAAAFIETFLHRISCPAGPVLDLGCGAGRYLAQLAAAGFQGFGLDLSAPLLAEALARRDTFSPAFQLIRGDMRHLPLAEASLAAVLSMFTSFGYFGRLQDHHHLLLEISRVLQGGGVWVLDYLNCRQVRARLHREGRLVSGRQSGPLLIREERYLSPDGTQVLKDVLIRPQADRGLEAAGMGVTGTGISYTEKVALFELQELRESAAAVNLEIRTQFGDYRGDPLEPDTSPRWLVILGKP